MFRQILMALKSPIMDSRALPFIKSTIYAGKKQSGAERAIIKIYLHKRRERELRSAKAVPMSDKSEE